MATLVFLVLLGQVSRLQPECYLNQRILGRCMLRGRAMGPFLGFFGILQVLRPPSPEENKPPNSSIRPWSWGFLIFHFSKFYSGSHKLMELWTSWNKMKVYRKTFIYVLDLFVKTGLKSINITHYPFSRTSDLLTSNQLKYRTYDSCFILY